MNRKQFIQSEGATCNNWTWSWSFINETDKIIIFGAWDKHTTGNSTEILNEGWQFNDNGKKKSAYGQSREHIRLIEEEGYQLKTFPLLHSDARKDSKDEGPAKIKGFIPELKTRILKRVGTVWYASDSDISVTLPEEVELPVQYIEGASQKIFVNRYERNLSARECCLSHHGHKCSVCDFDFEKTYGSIGKNYIHVHHIVPLSEIGKEYALDPVKDLVPVCPNCHAIIHRTQPALSINQLKMHIVSRK